MFILVTGALGFIGSHCVVELIKNGYQVIMVDNLVNSSIHVLNNIKKILDIHIIFYQCDITNDDELNNIFNHHQIDAVIHLAGYKSVSESIADPLKYYENNVGGLLTLLKCMKNHHIKKIVFSSSATVYGNPKQCPITEKDDIDILNPYGQTKYMCELILKDCCQTAIILRYFNPVGGYPLLGESPVNTMTNLFPTIMSVLNKEVPYLNIFGSNYNTKDGTAVRDYIHVVDLAKAHVKALEYKMNNNSNIIFNLGTGQGYTVLDIVNEFENDTHQKINYEFKERRVGDAEKVYADCRQANQLLGWQPEYDLKTMVKDTVLSNIKYNKKF